MRATRLALGLVLIALLSGCGGDRPNPLDNGGEPVASGFVDALSAGDWEQAQVSLSDSEPGGPPGLREIAGPMKRDGLTRTGPWRYEDGWLVVPMRGETEGTNSTVVSTGEFRVLLAKDEGAWKIQQYEYHGSFEMTPDDS